MNTAKDALDELFSSAVDTLFTYPSQAQIILCRIIGTAIFKLYYSYALLSDEQREQVCVNF